MLIITPETSTEVEYAPFSITYDISDDDPLVLPEIVSVAITLNATNYLPFLTFTQHSTTSFTILGTLSDVFEREMEFLDANDVSGLVSRFTDIPENFNTLYRYKGAMANSITLTVSVTTTTGSISAPIIVANNWGLPMRCWLNMFRKESSNACNNKKWD